MGVYLPIKDYSAMQGPCASGYHIPTNTEFSSLCSILTTTYGLTNNGTTLKTYLKMPFSGRRNSSNSNAAHQDSYGYYWTCTHDTNSGFGRNATLYSSYLYSDTNNYCAYGYSIRPFKDTSVTPDGSRTALYSDKIYHSSTLGLISIKDGDNRITISDKNLGATTVYNSGDALSQSNCGKYYQWGNNYGFDFTGSLTTSSSTVNASTYGPTNYYNSSTFIIINGGWDNSNNTNLRGGVTGVKPMSELKNAYIGEYREPGANTLAYYPLTSTSTVNDMKGSGTAYNLTNNGDVTFGTYDGISCAKFGGTQNTSCLYYNSSLFTGSAEFTVNIWHKQLSTYSGWHNNILGVGTHNGTNGFIEWVNMSNSHLYVGGWSNDRDTGYTMPVGTWQNIVYTHKSGTIKVYVDGTLKYTGTVSFAIQNGKTILGGGISSGNVSADNMQGYLSNVIFESVERTAQKITNYYNQTKSTYGL